MTRYFTSKNAAQGGPYSEDDVKAMLLSGALGKSDLFRKEGSETWLPLADFPGASSLSASGGPATAQKGKRSSKLIAALVVLALLLIGGCVFFRTISHSKGRLDSPRPDTPDAGANAKSSTPPPSPAGPTPTPPNYETWFIESVTRFESSVPAGSSQATIDHNRQERWLGIMHAFPGVRSLTGWVGTLRKADKTLDGRLAVAIELPSSNILVQSWPDPISDAGAGTLIDSKSDDSQRLRGLRIGSPVVFDVEFVESKEDWIKEGSKTVVEGFSSPKFIAHIKNLKGAHH
jgi:hypothetical protein